MNVFRKKKRRNKVQNFGIRFLICNFIISGLTILMLALRKLLRSRISPQIIYRLWFFLLAALFVPFLPVDLSGLSLTELLCDTVRKSIGGAVASAKDTSGVFSVPGDFAVSVSSGTSGGLNRIPLSAWAAGAAAACGFLIFSWIRFRRIRRSARTVENPSVRKIFDSCKREMNLQRQVELYSTEALKSPAAAGIFRPSVYLPVSVLSDFRKDSLRYVFLHELQHFRQHDSVVNLLAEFGRILYWFNPAVWYGMKKMRLDREIACDSAVLEILKDWEYSGYGHTLLDLAEKVSFSFSSGLGGSSSQIRLRILNIAGYRRDNRRRKCRGILAYLLSAALFLTCVPALTVRGSGDIYSFDTGDKKVAALELSDIFRDFEGSFVLYDSAGKSWKIYNLAQARKRVAPDSTYKIYAALHGLEQGVISPENSEMEWDGGSCPFTEWEQDQDLASAMRNSVNWYFQRIDACLGTGSVRRFLKKIHYGNETAGKDLALYWTDSSLKISPIEQVELFQKLYEHRLPFADENMDAVIDALYLGKTEAGTLYGKTGTGQVDHKNVNGWFTGCLETSGNVYYFAVNIQSDSDASGSRAAEIAEKILKETPDLFVIS